MTPGGDSTKQTNKQPYAKLTKFQHIRNFFLPLLSHRDNRQIFFNVSQWGQFIGFLCVTPIE